MMTPAAGPSGRAEQLQSDRPTGPRIVVAGGHSAGHIEPALAVADAVRRLDPTATVTALGTERGLDTVLIPARGYPLELIPPVPMPRRPNKALLQVPVRVVKAVRATRAVLDRVDAQVVIGFGGYVALPAYLAARRRGIPIVVHEANAKAGLANRVGAWLTRHVYTASASVKLRHSKPVGIPLRPAIANLDRAAARPEAAQRFGLDPDRPTLMVTGGSQGAQAINRAVLDALPDLLAAGVQVLHIVGPKNFEPDTDLVQADSANPGAGRYEPVPFVSDMQWAYAVADLVVCRSGAMTCAELAAVGLPAVFVPLPLRGGEQRLNADPVVDAGGGLVVSNADFTARWIVENVLPLLADPQRLTRMSAAAARVGNRNAADVLARRVLDLAGAQ
jgi:UDP-N-acetylglucosamine--N-acetylmuramyl-(pentapeptide) pyrophosphoryl-undecaprenol N-acetylglucosamine transferase